MFEFPSDAPLFSINGTKTVRVVSMHDGIKFDAVFRFDSEFYKFPVIIGNIDDVSGPLVYMARNKLFEMITSSQNVDTVTWRKKDFDNYFNVHPTYLTINCTGMDKYGRVLADVGDFAETLLNEKLVNRC
jgi:hypothetical protein